MANVQHLSLIASDYIAARFAKPKAYASKKFIALMLLTGASIVATTITAIIACYTLMINATALSETSAILILCGVSAIIAALSGWGAYLAFKSEERKAYMQTRALCDGAAKELLYLLDSDVTKPVQDNPLASVAVAAIAGAFIGQKLH